MEENKKKENDKKEEKEEKEILEELKNRCEEYLNGWKRAKADLINYQKDEQKRFEEIVKFSHESLVKELIAVLDSFDLSLVSLENPPAAKGMYLIRSQLESILERYGLKAIQAPAGEPFDPSLHEAIGEMKTDKPLGTVIEEVEKGYTLNGKVIRPARVKIAK